MQSLNYGEYLFDVVKINLKKDDLAIFLKDNKDILYRNFERLEKSLLTQNRELLFAMNGGIFEEGGVPTGLYIENGKIISPINTANGKGNFYLEPNGVFYFDSIGARIMTSDIYYRDYYKKAATDKLYAIQSGPMLVIDGEIHEKFSKDSESRFVRNGVGIADNGQIVFAISNDKVTLHEFASFFKNSLGIKNALYLDGAISDMYVRDTKWTIETKNNFATMIEITTNTSNQ